MTKPFHNLTDSRLANLGAHIIHNAYQQYCTDFNIITMQASETYAQCDWVSARKNAILRLDLYRKIIDDSAEKIRNLLADRLHRNLVWASMKAVYSGIIARHDDWEIAETFFNSVTRRIFTTVGVNPQIEFVSTDFETPPTQSTQTVYRVYDVDQKEFINACRILSDYHLTVPFADLDGDCLRISADIADELKRISALRIIERVEMVESVFYRGMAAYLVGRLYSGSHRIPFIIALLNSSSGMKVDRVIMEESAVSILFSFARSYFHVMVERPYDLVQFLKTIMPRKRTAELYISIGYNKHGKTELYRDLLHHLNQTTEQFKIARGQRGMVMLVFTMPNYDMVFKVIKDEFAQPKTVTHREVKEKYALVFKHDRAGRLVDAQSFEHLQIDRSRFSDELLEDLLQVAKKMVSIKGDTIIVKHLYMERRVIPLDLYVREAHEEAAAAAMVDYGQAIKDLAATNIFPGDMLLKNFGVTRHGRVVFYDYDELCLLTECNFRKIPQAYSYEDELSDRPWFHVGENDVFPEEFPNFLGISSQLQAHFEHHHGDLFDVAYWQEIQERVKVGEFIHIFPYARPNKSKQD